MTYILTKQEFCFLFRLITGQDHLPVELSRFYAVYDSVDNTFMQSMIKKSIIRSLEPLKVDSVIAFLLNRIGEADSQYFINDNGMAIVIRSDLIITINEDPHSSDHVRIIPFRDENALEKDDLYEMTEGTM